MFYVEIGDHAYFKSDLTSHPTTPDEWHTAEVLIGLHYSSSELGSNAPIMTKCVKWLESRRGDRFLWCNDMGSRISFIITGRVLHALALVDPSKAGVAIGRLVPVLKHHQTDFACSAGLVYDLPVTINLMLGISAKPSVKKRTSQNQLQTAILATQMHDLLEHVGKVKQATDKYATLYWLAILPYALFLVVAILAVTLPPIREIWTFIKELWHLLFG